MGYCGEGRGVEKIKAILDEEPRLVKAETRDWRLGKRERKTRSWILDAGSQNLWVRMKLGRP
jgi:hypothetical protein